MFERHNRSYGSSCASYNRVKIVDPEDKDHQELNIRLGDTPPAREDRLHNKKLRAAKIFASLIN